MIRSKRTSLSLLALSIALGGCSGSLLESKRIDYKSARQIERPLEIPPDLTAPQRDDRFAVPDVSPRGVATYSAYSADRAGQPATATASSAVLTPSESMRIERAGTQRWLVVGGTPEELWPQIKDFWLELGFILDIDSPEIGVMETDWAEDRAKIPQDFIRSSIGKVFDGLFSTPERDKFRTRLEQGKEAGTVEVYISHRGMYEIYVSEGKDQTRWQPREPDPELEAEMLRRLMMRFGSDDRRSQLEMAEAKNRPVDRAKLARSADGSGALEVEESFDRAWRRVGLALDRVGFTVEDRDRSKGLYYVRYVDPESDGQNKDPGLMSKLAFWKSARPDPQTKYRVFVKDGGSRTTVQVLSAEGGVDQSDTSKKILGLLFEQLK